MDEHGLKNGGSKSSNGDALMSDSGETAIEQPTEIRSLKDLDQALGQVIHDMDEALKETDRAVDAADELLSA